MDISLTELVLEQAVHTLHALALQLIVHHDHVAVEFLHVLPALKDVVHAADGHTAHRSPHVILCHVVQAVVIAVGADGHVEHQRVHVHDGVQTPAVIRPGAPVGVVQRRAGPGQHSVAGLREAVDFLSDTLVENLADVTVDLMPDRQIAELGLIDTVQSLCNAVDRVVVGLRGDIPLLPLELHQLVLRLDALDQRIPVERDTGLLFDKLPALLDLVAAMLLDQRIVKLHRLRHGEQRLVEEPVLQDGSGDGRVTGLVGGDNDRRIVGHVVEDEQAGLRLTHRARVARQADGLHRVNIVENGMAVDVAGDEVRDHLHRDIRQFAVDRTHRPRRSRCGQRCGAICSFSCRRAGWRRRRTCAGTGRWSR
jgi:hypothetical protein